MRVLYLHQYFNTRDMPGGTRSYEAARRLVARGHEVHLVTSRRSGGRAGWEEERIDGIHVHWCRVPYDNRQSYARRLRAFAEFAGQAAWRAARLGGDVVFATSTPLTVALPGVVAARRHRIPMVFEVRDLWPDLPIEIGALRNPVSIAAARRLERFAYEHAARVVALSPGIKDGVVRAGCQPERVVVIPNACDVDLFEVGPEAGAALRAQHEWLGDRPLVLYCGSLGRINGLGYLARLAREVRDLDPEVRFAVIGDGGERERVAAQARDLGVLDRTFFMLPAVPKALVPRWLSAATIATSLFVDVPGMLNNSANKFFDALAAGRPVVTNYGGWQAALLAEKGAGWQLPAEPSALAARRIVELVRDPARLAPAGAASRALAIERFSRDVLVKRLEDTLLEACAAGGPGGSGTRLRGYELDRGARPS